MNFSTGLLSLPLSNITDRETVIKLFNNTANNHNKNSNLNIFNTFIEVNATSCLNINTNSNNINNKLNENKSILLTKKAFDNKDEFISVISDFSLDYSVVNPDKSIKRLKSFTGHTERILDFTILEKYSVLASGSKDNKIKLYDIKGKENAIKEFKLKDEVASVYSYKEFLFAGTGRWLIVWNMKTMKTFAQLNYLHSGNILNINVETVDNNPYLITSGEDCIVNLIDLNYLINNSYSNNNNNTNNSNKLNSVSTDCVITAINTNKVIEKSNLLGNSLNYLYTKSSDYNISVYNMQNNNEICCFNGINEQLGSNYIVDVYPYNNGNNLELSLGSYNGIIGECSMNTSDGTITVNKIINTNIQQTIESICYFKHFNLVSTDTGNYHVY